MNGHDAVRARAHAFELALLQIGRQALVARAGVATTQRLPGEIVVVVRMRIEQAQHAIVQNLMERSISAEQHALLRRNSETEQKRGRPRQEAREARVKLVMQPLERALSLR